MSAAPDPSTHIHLAVALDGTGWHPASWREPDARPAELSVPPILDRPGQRGRTGTAGLRHHRRRPHAAVRAPAAGGRANRPRPRPTGRRTDRLQGGTPHQPHRAHSHGDHHAHRALPSVEGHRHARLRQLRSGRNPGAGLGEPRCGRPLRPAGGPRWQTVSSPRPPTTSRCCVGCGTAGRTTRRFATSPRGDSSTETSCTTSTSRAPGSPSRARPSRRGRRRDSRSSPRSATERPPTA